MRKTCKRIVGALLLLAPFAALSIFAGVAFGPIFALIPVGIVLGGACVATGVILILNI